MIDGTGAPAGVPAFLIVGFQQGFLALPIPNVAPLRGLYIALRLTLY